MKAAAPENVNLAVATWLKCNQPTVASDGTLPGAPIVFRCRKWARSAAQNCATSACGQC